MFSLIRVALVMVARHSCRKPNRDSCLLQSPVLNPWPPALCGTVLRMCKLYEVRPHWEKWVTGNVSLGLEDSILSQIYRFLLLPDPYEENMPFHRRLLVANMFSLQTQKHLGPKTMHWKLGKLDLKWFPPCSICYMGYSSAKKKKRKRRTQAPIIWLGPEIIASLGTPSPHFYHQCRKVSSQTCQLLSSRIRHWARKPRSSHCKVRNLSSGKSLPSSWCDSLWNARNQSWFVHLICPRKRRRKNLLIVWYWQRFISS